MTEYNVHLLIIGVLSMLQAVLTLGGLLFNPGLGLSRSEPSQSGKLIWLGALAAHFVLTWLFHSESVYFILAHTILSSVIFSMNYLRYKLLAIWLQTWISPKSLWRSLPDRDVPLWGFLVLFKTFHIASMAGSALS